MKLFYTLFLIILSNWMYAQNDVQNVEEAVMIGNIDMSNVIIHVYKTKEDQFPFKEFTVITDEATGNKQAINTSVYGKGSKGGFIIINGLKSKSEIENMVAGEKVYDEIVIKDVDAFEEYESIINDYIKESIIQQESDTETKPKESTSAVPQQAPFNVVQVPVKEENITPVPQQAPFNVVNIPVTPKAPEPAIKSSTLGQDKVVRDKEIEDKKTNLVSNNSEEIISSKPKASVNNKSSSYKPSSSKSSVAKKKKSVKKKSSRFRYKSKSSKSWSQKKKGGKSRTGCYSF